MWAACSLFTFCLFFFSTGDVFAQRKFFFGCHGTSSFSLHNCHLFLKKCLRNVRERNVSQPGGQNLSHLFYFCAPCRRPPLDCSRWPSLRLAGLTHSCPEDVFCCVWGSCFTPDVAITSMQTAAGRKEQVWCLHIWLPYLKKKSPTSVVVQISLIPTLSSLSQMCLWEPCDARGGWFDAPVELPLCFRALFSLCSGLTHPAGWIKTIWAQRVSLRAHSPSLLRPRA